MKLPITDQFLWELYNFLEKTDELFDLIFLSQPRSLRESVRLSKLKRKYERKRAKKSFSHFIYYLKKRGFIKIENLEGKKGVLLTRKGAEKILKTKFKIKTKNRRKDKKWMMVIFDIPEKKRKLRNLFRGYLQLLGFKMLQRSVWVCPYDISQELDKAIRHYSLDPFIKIFLIEEIEI